jgi:hypothetical protein
MNVSAPRKRDREKDYQRGPRNRAKLREIIFLREIRNMNWRAIGNEMGLSHQAPYLIYKRWRDWARENMR